MWLVTPDPERYAHVSKFRRHITIDRVKFFLVGTGTFGQLNRSSANLRRNRSLGSLKRTPPATDFVPAFESCDLDRGRRPIWEEVPLLVLWVGRFPGVHTLIAVVTDRGLEVGTLHVDIAIPWNPYLQFLIEYDVRLIEIEAEPELIGDERLVIASRNSVLE